MRNLLLAIVLASTVGCAGMQDRIEHGMEKFDAAKGDLALAGLSFKFGTSQPGYGEGVPTGPYATMQFDPAKFMETARTLGWDAHLGFVWDLIESRFLKSGEESKVEYHEAFKDKEPEGDPAVGG